ncbi:hypothetical protein [Simiduia agarivorans]|uniref:DNA gyrase subunit B n=1 Tax=Simiduia agarivorans (strain DSM 21679 / JCM 13881 / BCRC 17597 / SA1) TaxID=1117647 RepID=K4KKM0_SIMAS|nr:hypothetical protein [Simiduia agarivorans]AFU98593.1 hypothetical protein M5M_06990 [Simiduia agarivorans SA1 = DSM 21679]
MARLATAGFALLTVAYPFAIYFGSQLTSPRYLVLALVCIAGLRLFGWQLANGWARVVWGLAILVLATLSWVLDSDLGLLLYPVLVNASLFALFFTSLFSAQSLVEKLARIQQPDLPLEAVRYTRIVTQVWCGFFIFNGSIALYTALWADRATWLLYNGLVAYGLMALIAGIEWLVRRRVQARIAGAGRL